MVHSLAVVGNTYLWVETTKSRKPDKPEAKVTRKLPGKVLGSLFRGGFFKLAIGPITEFIFFFPGNQPWSKRLSPTKWAHPTIELGVK